MVVGEHHSDRNSLINTLIALNAGHSLGFSHYYFETHNLFQKELRGDISTYESYIAFTQREYGITSLENFMVLLPYVKS